MQIRNFRQRVLGCIRAPNKDRGQLIFFLRNRLPANQAGQANRN